MLILAVDSSASPASAALLRDGVLLGEFFINTKFTHSQTLMVLVEDLLKSTSTAIGDIDCFAVNSGPGSFTGVRIGVSAVKGMAAALDKPCVSVSTLEAMAKNVSLFEGVICCVMDARCSQVYNALFMAKNGEITRLCDDRALSIDELYTELEAKNQPTILVGDGAELCYSFYKEKPLKILLAPQNVRFQRAYGTAMCAKQKAKRGEQIPSAQLVPLYLRLPQAERELKKKLENKDK